MCLSHSAWFHCSSISLSPSLLASRQCLTVSPISWIINSLLPFPWGVSLCPSDCLCSSIIMARNLVLFFLISSLQLLFGTVSGQTVPQGHFLIRNTNALMADKGEVASFGHECLQKQYRDRIRQSQSIETLIEIVERLEENLANSTDAILSRFSTPDKVARLLLHR